eukprot:1982823-Prymnesium_polylepis.1
MDYAAEMERTTRDRAKKRESHRTPSNISGTATRAHSVVHSGVHADARCQAIFCGEDHCAR